MNLSANICRPGDFDLQMNNILKPKQSVLQSLLARTPRFPGWRIKLKFQLKKA